MYSAVLCDSVCWFQQKERLRLPDVSAEAVGREACHISPFLVFLALGDQLQCNRESMLQQTKQHEFPRLLLSDASEGVIGRAQLCPCRRRYLNEHVCDSKTLPSEPGARNIRAQAWAQCSRQISCIKQLLWDGALPVFHAGWPSTPHKSKIYFLH